MVATLVVLGAILIGIALLGGRVALLRAPIRRVALGVVGVWMLIGAGTAAFFASAFPAPGTEAAATAVRAQSPQVRGILIAGEDTDPDALVRGTPAFDRVLAAIADEFRASGIALVREGPPRPTPADEARPRRTDSEVLSFARGRPSQPDVVVVLTIGVPIQSPMQNQTATVRLAGRVLRVSDGRTIGTVQWVTPTQQTFAYSCNRPCIVETMTSDPKPIAVALHEQINRILQEHR